MVADNQTLSVIEGATFRAMLRQANPLAEAELWRSYNTLRAHILAEYESYVPTIIDYLRDARSAIHISFNNWTSTGGKQALTGICVYHLDRDGKPRDYILGLPSIIGQHTGVNIAAVVDATLKSFRISTRNLGYFILDNATNNNSAIDALAIKYDFNARYRRLRCACHIINLAAQQIIFSKDHEAFENAEEYLDEEEAFLDEWRKVSPLGVLIDVVASICTPQARQLLEQY